MPHMRLLRSLVVALTLTQLVHGESSGKGSESKQSSAEESGEDTEYEEFKKDEKKTGQQHKFWIPTYQGTNPLNRRKISITTSEIEKYDNSIDISLSGVNKNKTYQPERTQKDQNVSAMPHLWSGENATINERYVESLDSGGVTLEESQTKTAKKKKKLSSSEDIKSASDCSKSSAKTAPTVSTAKTSKGAKKKVKAELQKPIRGKILSTTKRYVEKAIVNQFFDELGKVTADDANRTPEYYRQLVQAATENTKKKLGYQKIPKAVKLARKSDPEIIAVNIDSTSWKKTRKEDEITFNTNHDQLRAPKNAKLGNKTSKTKNIQVKMNAPQKVEGKKEKLQKDTYTSGFRDDTYKTEAEYEKESEDETEDASDTMEKTDESEDSFTSFCDYSAWSDVLSRNRTDRKAKHRKPKTATITHTVAPSDIRKWPGKDIKRKANELRKKDGKSTRKEKREKAVKKRKFANKKERNSKNYKNDMDYNYDDDYPEKKLRMRTKGEKQHAVREVTDYLKEMDKQYGGIPGGERHGSNDRRRGRPREREDSYERRDAGWGRDRDKGRDRRRGRDDREGDRWNDRGRDGAGGRWDDRGDRRRGRDDRRDDRGGWGRDNRRDDRGGWGRGDRRDDRGRGSRGGRGWGRGGGRGRGRGGDDRRWSGGRRERGGRGGRGGDERRGGGGRGGRGGGKGRRRY